MSTLKVYDVAPDGLSKIARCLQKLANLESWSLEIEAVEAYDPQLKEYSQAMIIPPQMSDIILPQVTLMPSQVRSLWAVDSFFKDSGGWICRVLEFEALRTVLVTRAKETDTLKPAFIIGEGAKVRIAAAVLADLGFSEIYLVSEQEEALQQNMQSIGRSYIGLKFHPLLAQELTMQALNASVLINTVDLGQNTPLLNDLSYFNFMARGGLVFDYNLEGFSNEALLDEAGRAELALLSCYELAVAVLKQWISHLGLSLTKSDEELKELWQEVCKNPPSV